MLCHRRNDAPGTSARVLLQHMHQTFLEHLDTGKVAVLALPRSEEARAMKDDVGEQALTDAEGYQFKRMHVSSELSAEDLASVPMLFYNVEVDEASTVRGDLFEQLSRMRKAVKDGLFSLCAASGAGGGLRDGLTLTAKTEAMVVQTASGRGRGADGGNMEPAPRATVTRLRLGLEGSRPFALGSGTTLTPSLEIGVRHDGGEAKTRFGLDLGGGLTLSDPGRGLEAELRGRGLLSHESKGLPRARLLGRARLAPEAVLGPATGTDRVPDAWHRARSRPRHAREFSKGRLYVHEI